MKSSASLASFAAAFCKAQAQMTAAKKDAKNPAFNSAYADLHSIVSVIRPCLTANELSYLQFPVNSPNDEVGVETLITHSSGEWVLSDPCFIPVSKANAHGYGSALTYSRRYGLVSACGLETADDDGNSAVAVPVADKMNESLSAITDWRAALEACGTLDEVKACWAKIPKTLQKACEKVKDEQKAKLNIGMPDFA